MSPNANDASDNGALAAEPSSASACGASACAEQRPGPPGAPSTAQVLLGVLVVGQLLFLLVANSLNALSSMRAITGYNEDVGAVLDHVSGGVTKSKGHWFAVYRLANNWEELLFTGQNWRLFSPYVSDASCLLGVELRWDDGDPLTAAVAGARPPVLLKSANEPEDLEHYVRLGPWRFRRYELNLGMDLRIDNDETEAEARARWKSYIARHVDNEWSPMSAYINWKWLTYKRGHADCPTPRQVVLIARCWLIAPPDEGFGKHIGPTVVPVARWQPGQAAQIGTRGALETFDPETKRFER